MILLRQLDRRGGRLQGRHYTALCLAALLACTLIVWVADAAAAKVSVVAQRRGDTIDVHASTILRTDPITAWRVLTDYDHYADFIPNLRMSRVIARQGSTVTVEQSGDVVLWLLKVPVAITYEVTESPPDRIRSRAIGGTLRALASSYLLSTTHSGVRLDYAGQISPGYELFGRIEQFAVRKDIQRQFQALVDEIERRSASTDRE